MVDVWSADITVTPHKQTGKNADPFWVYLKDEQSGFITNAIKCKYIVYRRRPGMASMTNVSRLVPYAHTRLTGNFTKFLLKNGKPIKRFGPHEAPKSCEAEIQKALE